MTGDPGSGSSGKRRVDEVEDAFSVLGDETRLRILLVLVEVARERGLGEGLTFSELRGRVGVEDSGRFNYHLSQLRDGFVEKADGEYVARFPGLAVVSAVYAGLYTDGDADADGSHTATTDRDCQLCSRPLQIHYEDNALWLECPEHGAMDRYSAVPPGAATGRSLEELARTVYTRVLVNLFLARHRVCLQCWGVTTIEYPVEQPHVSERFAEEFVWARLRCTRCWNQLRPPLRTVVATHPVVLGAFRERGYDLMETVRQVARIGDEQVCETELHGTDPPGATLRIELEGETLVLTVDETCTVVERRRE